MLTSIVFNAWLWHLLGFLPLVVAFVAGAVLWSALFGVKGWNPRCRRCGHDLRQSLDASTCQECGANLARRGAVRAGTSTLRPGRLALGFALVGLVTALATPALLPPTTIRQWLADLVPLDALLAQAAGRTPDRFTQSVIDRRVAQGLDADTVESLIVTACNDVTAAGQPQPVVQRFLDEASKAGIVTDPMHARLADAWVQWMRTTQPGGTLVVSQGAFGRLVKPKAEIYAKALGACPECLAKLIKVTSNPNSAMTGLASSVTASTGMELEILDIDVVITISRVDVRREGETEWARADDESESEFGLGFTASRQLRADAFAKPGAHELRVAGTVRIDGRGASSTPFERVIPIVASDPGQVEAVAMKGSEARAAVEALAREIRFRIQPFEFGTQFSLSPPRGRGRKDQTIYVIAALTLVQGERAWPIGDVELGPNSMSMSGGMLDRNASDAAAFDPNAPFAIRFSPLPRERHRAHRSSYSHLDETFERRFTSAADDAPGFAWIDP
jgi:hypothetical protein